MRILAVEPGGHHRNLNSYMLRAMRTFADVTFFAPEEYLVAEDGDRLAIPQDLLRHNGKFGARVDAIRVLNYVLRSGAATAADIVFFLTYETVSLSLRWPRRQPVVLFEHNNLDNAAGSRLKTAFYRHLPQRSFHITFLERTAETIRSEFGRDAVAIPHPHYRRKDDSTGDLQAPPFKFSKGDGPTIIFSPSARTPHDVQRRLQQLSENSGGKYYAICKGERAESGNYWDVKPFFEDYDLIMASCDIVFVGGPSSHRVSGVAFEAISYGKHVAIIDCEFGRELKSRFPHLVTVICTIDDVIGLERGGVYAAEEQAKFLRDHSFDAVAMRLRSAIERLRNNGRRCCE